MDTTEVTAEDIQKLLDDGLTKTQIGEQYGISAQKVGMILASTDKGAVKTEVVEEIPPSAFAKTYVQDEMTENSKITIMTAGEYKEYSEANGRHWGRRKGRKTKATIEELRALINSGWKPSMIINKHGMDAEEFKQLVWQLSKKELRDRPLKFSIEQDFIEKG